MHLESSSEYHMIVRVVVEGEGGAVGRVNSSVKRMLRLNQILVESVSRVKYCEKHL